MRPCFPRLLETMNNTSLKKHPQTRLVEHDEMIQALAPNGPDQALNVRRLPWTSRSGEDFFRPHFSDALAEGFAVDSVTIPEQEARSCVPRKSLRELLCRPSSRGMVSHIEMDDSAALMGQHHEHKQNPESDCGNHEEIDRNHLLEMIVQESPPSLRRRFREADHVFANRGFGNLNAKFEQFAVHSGSSPKRIGLTHLPNEVPNFLLNGGPPGPPSSTLPSPVQPKVHPMPRNHRFRSNNDQGLPPPRPEPRKPDPEKAVAVLKPRALPLGAAQQDSELMAKSHDLQLQCQPWFEAGAE